jgi:ABC-type multidrug transport system ATPase subunit
MIIISTHYVELAFNRADDIILMNKGVVIHPGSEQNDRHHTHAGEYGMITACNVNVIPAPEIKKYPGQHPGCRLGAMLLWS